MQKTVPLSELVCIAIQQTSLCILQLICPGLAYNHQDGLDVETTQIVNYAS